MSEEIPENSVEASGSSRAEGGCLCGAVRYSVTGTPVARTLCHCISCRRATGGVSVGSNGGSAESTRTEWDELKQSGLLAGWL